ncbi:MAG TPA: peptidoglycan DD-metalloendopeptidase family protein [Burkholderiales bacterium]|nr:peptidoglycan DD-metalloendopeptidase family protein [Burkholderiales bacterium]
MSERTLSRLTAVALALLLAVFLPQAHSQTAQKKKDLEELRSRIEALQKELEKAEENKAEAADALRESERAISQTNRRLFRLAAQRRALNSEMQKLGRDAGALRARIEAEQAALGRLLYRQYVNGQPEVLRLLLSRQDPNETARQLQYLGYLWRARARLIADLKRDLAALDGLTERTARKSAELRLLEAEEAAEMKRLEREKQAHREVLARVSSEIAQQRSQISTLKRNEQRLTRLIERLAKEAARRKSRPAIVNRALPQPGETASAFGKLKGRLRLPVVGELANRFGSPRQDSGLSWKGLFISAPAGREVKAVAAGRVVYADWLRGFGNLMILDHGDGYMSLYGNNEALLKQVGEEASPGEAIASVGNSGGNPDSGLYFELRYQGKPFDPLPWVRLR